jgi:hypothetical protein
MEISLDDLAKKVMNGDITLGKFSKELTKLDKDTENITNRNELLIEVFKQLGIVIEDTKNQIKETGKELTRWEQLASNTLTGFGEAMKKYNDNSVMEKHLQTIKSASKVSSEMAKLKKQYAEGLIDDEQYEKDLERLQTELDKFQAENKNIVLTMTLDFAAAGLKEASNSVQKNLDEIFKKSESLNDTWKALGDNCESLAAIFVMNTMAMSASAQSLKDVGAAALSALRGLTMMIAGEIILSAVKEGNWLSALGALGVATAVYAGLAWLEQKVATIGMFKGGLVKPQNSSEGGIDNAPRRLTIGEYVMPKWWTSNPENFKIAETMRLKHLNFSDILKEQKVKIYAQKSAEINAKVQEDMKTIHVINAIHNQTSYIKQQTNEIKYLQTQVRNLEYTINTTLNTQIGYLNQQTSEIRHKKPVTIQNNISTTNNRLISEMKSKALH